MFADTENQEIPPEERVIDRIATEKSGLKRSLKSPEKPPNEDDDIELRMQLEEARARQRMDRERQIKRYQVASMAYLGAYLRNPVAVSEVWERVVDKWLAGQLSSYDENRSFRKYLKTVLRNEVNGYWTRQGKKAECGERQLDSGFDREDSQETTASNAFDVKLRDVVLEHALEAVRNEDTHYFDVLKLLMDAVASEQSTPSSKDIAEALSERRGTRISEDNARQTKKRARELYSIKIIQQVRALIGSDDLEKVERSLRDLGLIVYCEKSLRKLKGDD